MQCNKSFTRTSYLKSHVKKLHTNIFFQDEEISSTSLELLDIKPDPLDVKFEPLEVNADDLEVKCELSEIKSEPCFEDL